MSGNVLSDLHDGGVALPSRAEVEPSRAEVEAGTVLKWRRRGDTWEGLLARETADGTLLTQWLPALVLMPFDATTS